jgi:hypothetical protein
VDIEYGGAYLQGSFALGNAEMYSDCDFLVATRRALTPAQEQGVRKLHTKMRTWPNHWAGHIEGSYVPQDDLRSLAGLGRRWLFVDQGHSGSDMEWSTHCNTEVVRWILRLDAKWKDLISETLEGRSLGWNHSDPLKPGALEATLAFNEYAKRRAAQSGL